MHEILETLFIILTIAIIGGIVEFCLFMYVLVSTIFRKKRRDKDEFGR